MTRAHRRRETALALAAVLVGLLILPAPPGGGVDAGFAQLDRYAALSDAQAQRMIAAHPSLELQVRDAAPAHVVSWWAAKDRKRQRTLIRHSSGLIGNLDGVDYASRDAANRRQLAARLATEEAAVAAHPGDAAARDRLTALTAIHEALRSKGGPRRTLVSFTHRDPPLAAIAVGDLDTARQVTFTVPGMGTYTDDMQLWTETAQNVYDAQAAVGAPAAHAVVAWIGYRTPAPGIDATLGDSAERGAPLLASEIQGLRAARAHGDLATVSVIAHSYGSTMAADALAARDLGVYSFVMLGSAGVEDGIAGVRDLHARHVYAGEAADDAEAVWGRLSRQDPRAPGFGATVIQVDGDPSRGLLPVTGHAPVLHSRWNDDPRSAAWTTIQDPTLRKQEYAAHERSFGYLDAGTESLRNAAIATTMRPTEALATDPR
ncbi:alpha/beta hydrolase [Clavibacter sp. Sh2036]|uniref:alpha/beta hydrolase n=1 Tax=unclassified Clavibacter TaxID=2626594 RepID=UPI0022EA1C0D|nr:alpha/beta hydrolase [Clavibacter sp. CT19]MDA3805406.1 alpha/beta hydrolase [Clavibacter sp. CT19]